MRDELIKAGDMNVIVVDWAGGSLPLYTQATANTRLVGLELAYFINYLIVSIQKFYDIDHIILTNLLCSALLLFKLKIAK